MLLKGPQLASARSALTLLSEAFLAAPPRAGRPTLEGDAGLALVHAALEHARPDAGHAQHAARLVQRSIDALSRAPLAPTLFEGYVGTALVVEVLCGDLDAERDPNRRIDEALSALVATGPWTGDSDLTSGLVGIGVYALERLPRASATQLLTRVIDRLGELARRRAPGLAWRSAPGRAPEALRRTPDLRWDLGVAHGAPGVVGMLGRAVGALGPGRARDKALRLLSGAVAWLSAQELPRSSASRFPSVLPSASAGPARLAWCYGDAGIAAALLVAARGARNRGWERTALRIALAAAARPYETSGVVDAGLCHGAAGVAHIFHRMSLTTGERRLATAARTWFGHTLRLRTASAPAIGGFSAWDTQARRWVADSSFLTGAGGVALALVAATTDSDPSWDRALLIS